MEHLTTRQAAERLGIPEATLRWWRSVGKGPPSFTLGHRVFYRLTDVEAWVEAEYRRTLRPGSTGGDDAG
jgi:predicted site-specific integrase-resolvase